MSDLFGQLKRVFDDGHAADLSGLVDIGYVSPKINRHAAVLIAVTERSVPGVLMIHRPETMRSHAGQIAFPGGKLDPGEDAVQAALREADEELALKKHDIKVIGSSDRFVTGTGFDITPVLATITPDRPIIPNPDEVSDWFEAPLHYVLDPANHVLREKTWPNGMVRTVIEIEWEGRYIWGITASIIANLSRRLAWQGWESQGLLDG